MEKNLLDGQFLVRFVKRYLFLAVLFLSSNFWSQILWSSTNGSAYRTAGNWTGGAVPTSSQIAQFAVNPTPATFIGININSAQQVGAIEVTNARSIPLQIGNSGNSNSSGLLQFNGAAVNSVSNVIIRNNSSQLLTFQDLVSGATGSKLGLVLSNATSNIINIDGAGGVTISSIISGTGKLEKSGSGSGILILSGANTYSGGTTITSGTLQLGAVNALPVGNPGNGLVLNGGTLKTGATSGFSSGTSSTNNIGTLNLSSNSTITLGTGNHSLYFAASNAVSWSGSALTITGWTGSAGATGTAGKIFVGSNASGLTGAQLAKITFSGYTAGAALLSTGELVPTSTVSPTVTTATVTGITNAAASGGGDVTADGGAAITARGVAFGTAANPTTGTTETGTTGVFTSSISGLAVNTRYYYRAYATNSAGTSYGTENNFYTLANAPSAPGVGSPTETSLTVSIGSGDGNPSITEYAIQTGSQFVQADGTLGATAIWQTSSVWGSKIVTGLSSSTNYIFHVKARNGSLVETSYGATGDSTTLVNQNIDWGNIQFPTTVSIMEGATVDVYTQAFKNGLTESAGQAPGLSAWIGYSSSNSNPNGTGWTWIPSTFNSQSGNNDEFKTTFGAGLIPGSYYYASRFQIGSGSYSYGGTGGLWNNDNGVLTVGSNVVDFANIQSPSTATIVQGGNFNVYTKVYKTGYTETAGANANLSGWIGYSATNAATISDFANASWTWIPATFNVQVLNDDEYVANIGMSLPAGVFYYVSRYKVNGSTEYKYGGINNNFWNTAANSGVLTVQTPKEINIKQSSANIATNGTYTFASQAAGTSSSAITFTVENTGQESLSVGALSISGANANEFSITQVSGSLPQSVTGGGTTTFTVTFSPTIAGSKVAQLSLVNDDANENPYVINLSAVAGPSNDNCSFPASITVNATAAAGTLVASSPQSGFSENDVWYTFTPSCTGQLALTLNGFTGADLGFSVFANSCPASNTGAIVNQDSGSTGGAETNTFSYTGGTTYYVRVWKFGGADTIFNFRITSPALGTPTNITANPTTFCEGATVIFTATAVTNATSYVWTVPSGWTINSTSSNTMTATVGSAAGAVTAKAINCYGEGIQKSQSFTPGVIPAIPGNITGNVTVCQGASNTYSVTAVSGATSYTWIMPSGWTGTSTTNSITLAAGGLSGTISVTANNTCGSSAAQTLSVTVTPAPVAIAGADITATTFTANWVSVGATGYELDVSTSPTFGTYGSTSVSESFFNANFNTGYYTSATDVVLGTGTWNMYQVLKTTSNYNTSSTEPAGVQMRAGQGIIITPAIDYISSITFIARRTGTTANKINVYKIVNGTETLLQQLDDNSSFTTYNVPVNETNTAVRIKIASASNTIYLDDVTINSNISIPSFVTGYNALPVSGNSQIVSGLSPNTTYYYRVRAVSGSCHTSNSNIITVTTNNTVIWTNNIWTNNTGPTSILDAIVRDTYSTSIKGSFNAKDLTVENTGKVIIGSGDYVKVEGVLTIDNNITKDNFVISSGGNLLQTSNAANNANGIIQAQRFVTSMNNDPNTAVDYVYWSAPVNGQRTNTEGSEIGFSPGTPANRFFEYNELKDTFKATADSYFVAGKGYAVRAETGTNPETGSNFIDGYDKTYNFRGVPNNGDISINLTRSNINGTVGLGFNLIGNPYPSNIDFRELYAANTNVIYNTAYFWTNNVFQKMQQGSGYGQNNYAVFNGSGGNSATKAADGTGDTTIPDGLVSVGQGFIVQAKNQGGSALNFKNSYSAGHDLRLATNSHFFQKQTSGTKNRFWIKLISPANLINTQLIAYVPGATNAFEQDYDAETLSTSSDVFYSVLGSRQLLIQGRAEIFTINDLVPLGANFYQNGTYSIGLDKTEGIFGSQQKIYLKDKLLGKIIDLTQGGYSFQASKGLDNTRFEIVYKDEGVLEANDLSKSDFTVYKDADYFVVTSSEKLGRVELYDAGGRLIISRTFNDKVARINGSSLVSGVYIIKVDNAGKTKTKKLIK